MATRPNVFEESDELDLSGFTPTPVAGRPPAEQVRQLTESTPFRSREPGRPPEAAPAPRKAYRRRTGRTVLFGARVTQDAHDAFYAIAERQGWTIGETTERALAALQATLAKGRGAG